VPHRDLKLNKECVIKFAALKKSSTDSLSLHNHNEQSRFRFILNACIKSNKKGVEQKGDIQLLFISLSCLLLKQKVYKKLKLFEFANGWLWLER
jgi:hypothetical protein